MTTKNKNIYKSITHVCWGCVHYVRRGWTAVGPVFVHWSFPHSCVWRGCGAPRNCPSGPWRRPRPCPNTAPSGSRTTGPAGCSPCSPCPGRSLRSQAACSPRCRRRRPPGRWGADPHAASQWSPGRRDASWGCTANTSASGCVWVRGEGEWDHCWKILNFNC